MSKQKALYEKWKIWLNPCQQDDDDGWGLIDEL